MINLKEIALQSTISVLQKAITRYAKEGIVGQPIALHEVQLWIGTRDEQNCTPYYWLVKQGQPFINEDRPQDAPRNAELSFEEVMDVAIDITGKAGYASVFMAKTIAKFAKECNTDPRNIEIQIISPESSQTAFPVPFLYDRSIDDTKPVKQLFWENDIFTDEINNTIMSEVMNQNQN